jgi:hypothetical protein
MTGSELRRIRNSLELSRVAFGRALGYRGENVDRMIRRLEAGERKITEEVAEIARKLWLAPAFEGRTDASFGLKLDPRAADRLAAAGAVSCRPGHAS